MSSKPEKEVRDPAMLDSYGMSVLAACSVWCGNRDRATPNVRPETEPKGRETERYVVRSSRSG